jgi:hypothetical protein
MKKTALYLLLIIAMFSSCTNEPPIEAPANISKDSLLLFKLPVAEEKIFGFYGGDFGGAPISISLRYISGKNISGYNIYKGIKRNIKGTIVYENEKLHLLMSEPGTEKNDGRFDIYLNRYDFTGTGTWYPTANITLSKKTFKLKQLDEDMRISYGEFIDSLNNSIILKENGFCEYAYFVNEKTDTEQKLKISGSYKVKADSLTIYWQSNNVLPERNSFFKIIDGNIDDTSYTPRVIVGKQGRFAEVDIP